ncbi:MAG: hypothetical protein HYV29_01585 [Ignavibacteriales bacterium]|nr:hypothetical protein [Ignavibacteriales bacterium]
MSVQQLSHDEIKILLDKMRMGTISLDEQLRLSTEILKLSNHPYKDLTREESILYWMYAKNCTHEDAERWVATLLGEIRPGKQSDGSYID